MFPLHAQRLSRVLSSAVFALACMIAPPSSAWDSTGHRLSANVALRYLDINSQRHLLAILKQHPRYELDFQQQMPQDLIDAPPERQLGWLLGQAAYWPDIARGFNDAERDKYSRPAWHYIDGAWLRGAASEQGNVYVNRSPAPDIFGTPGNEITLESQVNNVVTALDYNTYVLADSNADPAKRAVALCWVLHLMGDIHQPLHSGSLYSASLFETGDRGGNAIGIDDSNLHSRWDQALRGADQRARELLYDAAYEDFSGQGSDWTLWLAESRSYLTPNVYSPALLGAITQADTSGLRRLPNQELDDDYVSAMVELSAQRLGLAGLRLAIWFQNALSAD
jgi:hypothetical protein